MRVLLIFVGAVVCWIGRVGRMMREGGRCLMAFAWHSVAHGLDLFTGYQSNTNS